jgi:hypothetical protein
MQMTSEQAWLQEQVRKDYASGMNLWQLGHKYKGTATHQQIRAWLGKLVRVKGIRDNLSEEEVAQRKSEVQSWWTPEQASRRWVGRLITRPETIHSSASKLLPD